MLFLSANFRLSSLRENIKLAATKFQKSFHIQVWRQISSFREKNSVCVQKIMVGQAIIFSFYFWKNIMELIMFQFMRASKIHHEHCWFNNIGIFYTKCSLMNSIKNKVRPMKPYILMSFVNLSKPFSASLVFLALSVLTHLSGLHFRL